jgi:hypothetical protein
MLYALLPSSVPVCNCISIELALLSLFPSSLLRQPKLTTPKSFKKLQIIVLIDLSNSLVIPSAQPTTQNNLKQLLGWYYYRLK